VVRVQHSSTCQLLVYEPTHMCNLCFSNSNVDERAASGLDNREQTKNPGDLKVV
jgi:hypothetical protein